MLCVSTLMVLCFGIALAFPPRNDESNKQGNIHENYLHENKYAPQHLVQQEPRELPRKSYKRVYVPMIDGQPIFIPPLSSENQGHFYATHPPKRLKHKPLDKKKRPVGIKVKEPTKDQQVYPHAIEHPSSSKANIKNPYPHPVFKTVEKEKEVLGKPKHTASPSKTEDISSQNGYMSELSLIDKKHKPDKVKLSYSPDDESKPIEHVYEVLEDLSEKHKPEVDANKHSVPEMVTKHKNSHVNNGYETPVLKTSPDHQKVKPEIKYEKPEKISKPQEKEYDDSFGMEKSHGKENLEHPNEDYEEPTVVEVLRKVEKPTDKDDAYEKTIVIPLTKKHKPEVDKYEEPVVVEVLTKKDRPEDLSEYKKTNVEALTKDEKTKHKDYYEVPVEHENPKKKVHGQHKKKLPEVDHKPKQETPDFESLPDSEMAKSEEYDEPVLVEAFTVNEKNKHHKNEEKPVDKDYESPAVVKTDIHHAEKDDAHKIKITPKPTITKQKHYTELKETSIGNKKSEHHKIEVKPGDKDYEMPVTVKTVIHHQKKGDAHEVKPHSELESNPDSNAKDDIKNIPTEEVLDKQTNPEEISFLDQPEPKQDVNMDLEDINLFGSGMDLDERSSLDKSSSRSFLPVDSNVWSLISNIQSQERSKFKSCTTAKKLSGTCMPIQLCPVPNVASTVDELMSNVCIIDDVFVGICCPEFPVESVTVQWEGVSESSEGEEFTKKDNPSEGCGKLPVATESGNIWPWMVSLVTTSEEVFCGGVLVNERFVLTAAHCTTRIPLNRILVRIRSLESPAEDIQVVEIKRHAQYNRRSKVNDLALLKLAKKPSSKQSVCLPDNNENYEGEDGILLGWKAGLGETQDVEWLPVISKGDCVRKLGIALGDSILCTEPRADELTCHADSGAPLVLNHNGRFKLIGIMTWNRHDCEEMQPTLFTRISAFTKWVEKHSGG